MFTQIYDLVALASKNDEIYNLQKEYGTTGKMACTIGRSPPVPKISKNNL